MSNIRASASLNLKGFEDLRKSLSKGEYVAVGVFGEHDNARPGEPVSNLEVALLGEFGSISNNIPARSFIRMPIQEKSRDIVAFANTKKMRDLLLSGEKKKALALLGVFAENIIQKAFDTSGFGKWAPNAPSTIDKKGSDKPLIDLAELRKAVWSKVVAK